MTMVKGMNKTRLDIERLDDRLVLNATIASIDGVLSIKGSGDAEHLRIEQTATRMVVVKAEENTSFNNGQTEASFSGVTAISVSLAGGGDVLKIIGHQDHGFTDVTIDDGGGDD